MSSPVTLFSGKTLAATNHVKVITSSATLTTNQVYLK
jgi:hypothetical protein